MQPCEQPHRGHWWRVSGGREERADEVELRRPPPRASAKGLCPRRSTARLRGLRAARRPQTAPRSQSLGRFARRPSAASPRSRGRLPAMSSSRCMVQLETSAVAPSCSSSLAGRRPRCSSALSTRTAEERPGARMATARRRRRLSRSHEPLHSLGFLSLALAGALLSAALERGSVTRTGNNSFEARARGELQLQQPGERTRSRTLPWNLETIPL